MTTPKPNQFDKALAGGTSRRRTAGEMAGGGTEAQTADRSRGERRIAVDVPASLYQEAKLIAVQQETTVKEIIIAGLASEVAKRRS